MSVRGKSPLQDADRHDGGSSPSVAPASSDALQTQVVPGLKISDDRIERLGRELDLGEALLRDERKQAEQALVDVHRSLGLTQEEVVERDRAIGLLWQRVRELEAIEASVTWRIARRLRDALAGAPRLHRAARATLNLIYWIVAGQLGQGLRARQKPQEVAAVSSDSLRSDTRLQEFAVAASGWLGGERFQTDRLFAPGLVALAESDEAEKRYREQSARLLATDQDAARAVASLRAAAPTALIAETFRKARADAAVADSRAKPLYCIVTVVDADTRFLRACAASVRSLIDGQDKAARRGIEWLIVNDDPATVPETLAAMLGEGLHGSVRILHDGERRGTVARLNEACRTSGPEWLLLLRGDDEIEPHALSVIDRYVERFPKSRYISSCAADIDEAGAVLRWRRCADPSLLFEDEERIGPLIAIRRDLVREVGGWRSEHWPCHDYDLALRAALQEPLLCIPDYLCRSRWRKQPGLQPTQTANVLRDFLRKLVDEQFAVPSRPAEQAGRAADLKAGLCLIRTQGKRPEFLEEAILSVCEQTVPVTPCVIVHGSENTASEVRSRLIARGIEAVVITAPDLSRRRGYPLNVGLDWLRRRAGDYGFFLFLDDDDVLYPFLAARLVELLNFTGADVGVADANSRIPWQPSTRSHNLKPAAALLAGNFMPIHSFIMRTSLLANDALRFDEEIDYLEDWDFLVSLFATSERFRFLPEALCEFRIIGDGSTPEKNRPIHFEFCRRQILARAADIARRFGPGRLLRDLADFDFGERPGLTPYEIEHLRQTRVLFQAEDTETQG